MKDNLNHSIQLESFLLCSKIYPVNMCDIISLTYSPKVLKNVRIHTGLAHRLLEANFPHSDERDYENFFHIMSKLPALSAENSLKINLFVHMF